MHEALLQELLQSGQPGQTRRPAHQLERGEQHRHAGERIERMADVVDQMDLAGALRGRGGRAVGGRVARFGHRARAMRGGDFRVEFFGQLVELDRAGNGGQRHFGQQRRHLREDAFDIGVALRKIARAIQLFEEELRGAPIARAGEQVGVSAREARSLPGLELEHVGPQTRVGRIGGAQLHHGGQMAAQSRRGAFLIRCLRGCAQRRRITGCCRRRSWG